MVSDGNMPKRGVWLFIALGLVGLDQITKFLSLHFLALNQQIDIFPFLDLTMRHNPGAAFSFLSTASGWQRWFFIILAAIASIIIYYWLGKVPKNNRLESLGLSFILGGALGNVIDRLVHGYVIDFILLHYQHWEWPAFNIADSVICLGVLFLLPALIRKQE